MQCLLPFVSLKDSWLFTVKCKNELKNLLSTKKWEINRRVSDWATHARHSSLSVIRDHLTSLKVLWENEEPPSPRKAPVSGLSRSTHHPPITPPASSQLRKRGQHLRVFRTPVALDLQTHCACPMSLVKTRGVSSLSKCGDLSPCIRNSAHISWLK